MGDRPSWFHNVEDWAKRPVESVSWAMVQEFLAKLQRRLPMGWEADLPTEAQWEYAARAGTQGAYWWGEGSERGRATWHEEQNGTTAVDRYGANPWGLFDVHGNVWEWCKGFRRAYDNRAQVDPADAVDEHLRALRGGSWGDDAGWSRAAFRWDNLVDKAWHDNGFRILLRSVSEPRRLRQEGTDTSLSPAAAGHVAHASRIPTETGESVSRNGPRTSAVRSGRQGPKPKTDIGAADLAVGKIGPGS